MFSHSTVHCQPVHSRLRDGVPTSLLEFLKAVWLKTSLVAILFHAVWWERLFLCLQFTPRRDVEEVTYLWKCSLQLLSLALTTPQCKVNCVLCQGVGSGKGSRREGLCPVLFRKMILKYVDVPVLMKPLGFSHRENHGCRPCVISLVLLQDKYCLNWKQDTRATKILQGHHFFLLFNCVLIHHCHLPAFSWESQHLCPGFVRFAPEDPVSLHSVGFGWLPVHMWCRRFRVHFLSILPAVQRPFYVNKWYFSLLHLLIKGYNCAYSNPDSGTPSIHTFFLIRSKFQRILL